MNRLTTFLIFGLLLSVTTLSFGQEEDVLADRYQKAVFEEIDIDRNIVYGRADRYDTWGFNVPRNLSLDFYEPKGDSVEKRPLVLFYFGGAFLVGDKALWDVQAWCDSLAHHGYACAGVNYRLGFNVFNEASAVRAVYRAVQDSRAAVRFFKEFHEEFGIDTTRIYLGGNSAGSLTALHTTFMNQEIDRPSETYGVGGFFNRERADLGCMDCSGNDYEHSVEVAGVLNLWGALYDTLYIDPYEQVPVMSIHGTDDGTVPFNYGKPFSGILSAMPALYGSQPITERLDNLGIPNEFHPYEGEGHAFYGSLVPNGTWSGVFDKGRDFLWKTLEFDSALPQGEQSLFLNDIATYRVELAEGMRYKWQVKGGIIIENKGHEITINWQQASNENSVSIQEIKSNGVIGHRSALEVQIVAPLDLAIGLTDSAIENTLAINGISPVPVQDQLSINFTATSAESLTIQVYSLAGQLLKTKALTSDVGTNNTTLDVSDLGSGMYILSLEKEGILLKEKFVK